MINLGFNFVTVGSDQRFITAGAKSAIGKFKQSKNKDTKGY